jgi:AraC-like DNA-binding protein
MLLLVSIICCSYRAAMFIDDAKQTHIAQILHDPSTQGLGVNLTHPLHELLLLIDGQYTMSWRGGRLEASPLTGILIPAGVVHRSQAPRNRTCRLLLLQWSGRCPVDRPRAVPDTAHRLLGLLRWLHDLVSEGGDLDQAMRTLLAELAVTECARQLRGPPTREDDPLVQARQFLDSNYMYHLQIPDVGLRIGLSAAHLRRRFTARYGMPPLRYLQARRIEAAIRLLQTTRHTLGEVAPAVGFASPAHLSRLLHRDGGPGVRQLRRR